MHTLDFYIAQRDYCCLCLLHGVRGGVAVELMVCLREAMALSFMRIKCLA